MENSKKMRQRNGFLKAIPFIILISTIVSTYQLPLVKATTVELPVPYHSQSEWYYCGPACMEMVFDYWGPDIDQYEIADAAWTDVTPPAYGTYPDRLRRAGHFSDMSTSSGENTPHVTGYTNRGLGYATFQSFSGCTISDLENLLDAGYPVIVLQWGMEPGTPNNYGHFRVVIGYNDATQQIKVHDPASWLLGPDFWMSYSDFNDYWEYATWLENKAILTCPWDVTVTAPATANTGDTFTVTVDASYPRPAPFTGFATASSSEATITLPAGLSLASGETATKTLGTGSMSAGGASAGTSWNVVANTAGSWSISVEAQGLVSGDVYARPGSPFPGTYPYTDRIGGVDSAIVNVDGDGEWTKCSNPSSGGDWAWDVAVDGTSIYVVGFDNKPGNDRWRIEKRSTTDGSRIWTRTPNPSSGDDEARGIAVYGTSLYVVGHDERPGTGDRRWRVEKRSTGGSRIWTKTANPSSGWDSAWDVAVDSSGVYIVGYEHVSGPEDYRWRMEKRNHDGSLIWKKTVNPSSGQDVALGVAVKGTSVYIVGCDEHSGDRRWRMEKRSTTDGSLIWLKTTNPSSGLDAARSVAVEGSYAYVVGYDYKPGNGRWRMEKRSLSTGNRIWLKTSNPSGEWDEAYSVAIHGSSVYIVGYDYKPGNGRWRMETRSTTDGSRIRPPRTSNPSGGWDKAHSVAVDSSGTYTVGYDFKPGNYRWRIEKRPL